MVADIKFALKIVLGIKEGRFAAIAYSYKITCLVKHKSAQAQFINSAMGVIILMYLC